jgi:hypothetical protein
MVRCEEECGLRECRCSYCVSFFFGPPSPMADAIVRKNPSEFLKTLIGRPVVVRLNSGVEYRGNGWL